MCLSVTGVPGVHGDEKSLGLEWRLWADVGAGNWTELPVQEEALLTAGPSFQPCVGSWWEKLGGIAKIEPVWQSWLTDQASRLRCHQNI